MFIAVCLVTLNLRMTITGVGPLLDEIAADQGVSPAALGALASVPLLAWAAVSPLAQGLAARIGINAAVGWSLVVLMLATVWRSVPGSPINLWLGTALLGAALAIGNVLLPAAIKRDFGRRVPLVMGVYSALLAVSAAVGAGMVAPIAHFQTQAGATLGWHWALLATGVTAPFALGCWLWATTRLRAPRDTQSASPTYVAPRLGRRVWRDPVAWCIAVYMGSQSWVFYTYATWFAPIELSRGVDPVVAGANVMFFHICGMIGSLAAPFIVRGALAGVIPVAAPLTSAIGAVGFVFAPNLLWLAICGISGGITLFVSLNYIAQRSKNAQTASAVSGMAQSFGYLIAGFGPILFGWLYGMSAEWGLPLVVVFLGAAAQVLAALALWRERMALPGVRLG